MIMKGRLRENIFTLLETILNRQVRFPVYISEQDLLYTLPEINPQKYIGTTCYSEHNFIYSLPVLLSQEI